jgi:exonuclease III
MRLISWNVAGRVKRCEQQVGLITSRAPDIIALQEVTTKSYSQFEYLLKEHGFNHIIESVQLGSELGRRYGELIASRLPLNKLPASDLKIPWSERVLSAIIEVSNGHIEFHTVHIPPGSSNGWIKIDIFEGIYNRLAMTSDVPRILCGDFNSPQFEKPGGTIVTWGQKEKPNGEVYIKRNHQRWDAGERSVLKD